MAQLYATGPVAVYVGVGSGRSAVFLGHGERAPEINIHVQYQNAMCDLGGTSVPFDKVYDGEFATVGITLMRWDELQLQAIDDKAVATLAGSIRGINDPGEIGTLMVAEGAAYPLWLRFPYSSKVAFQTQAFGPMPAGYHFFEAFVEGPENIISGTGTPRKVRINFTCLRAFNPNITNAISQGRLTLYDHNMAGLPSQFD